jgi:hypothetical protein
MPSTTNPLLTQSVSEKLTKLNHALWHAQVSVAIGGARLFGFLTRDAKAPPTKITEKGANNKETKASNPK